MFWNGVGFSVRKRGSEGPKGTLSVLDGYRCKNGTSTSLLLCSVYKNPDAEFLIQRVPVLECWGTESLFPAQVSRLRPFCHIPQSPDVFEARQRFVVRTLSTAGRSEKKLQNLPPQTLLNPRP